MGPLQQRGLFNRSSARKMRIVMHQALQVQHPKKCGWQPVWLGRGRSRTGTRRRRSSCWGGGSGGIHRRHRKFAIFWTLSLTDFHLMSWCVSIQSQYAAKKNNNSTTFLLWAETSTYWAETSTYWAETSTYKPIPLHSFTQWAKTFNSSFFSARPKRRYTPRAWNQLNETENCKSY